MSEEENEGKLLKRIQDKIIENHTYHDGSLVDAQTSDVVFTISEVLGDAKKEFYSLLEGEPLDWIYHTGEKKQKFEELLKKWFGK